MPASRTYTKAERIELVTDNFNKAIYQAIHRHDLGYMQDDDFVREVKSKYKVFMSTKKKIYGETGYLNECR